MLYVFELPHGWLKFGVAERGAWERFEAFGFWHMRHPEILCNKLAFDDVQLIAVFEGGLQAEAQIKSVAKPCMSEFYAPERRDELMAACQILTPLPMPPRPCSLQERRCMRSCCLGLDAQFGNRRLHHIERSQKAGQKTPCEVCGKLVTVIADKRKRHQKSKQCRSAQ